MLVEMGNRAPTLTDKSPAVTTFQIPDSYTYVVADTGVEIEVGVGRTAVLESAADVAVELMRQVLTGNPIESHMPDHEAALAVINGWRAESLSAPTWVWSDNEAFAVLLGEFFGCPVGRPGDVEATHHTAAGPPGVYPAEPETAPADDPEATE